MKPFISQLRFLTHNKSDKSVDTFLKCVSPKMNIMAELEFESTYYEVSVKYVSPKAMEFSFHQLEFIVVSVL